MKYGDESHKNAQTPHTVKGRKVQTMSMNETRKENGGESGKLIKIWTGNRT
jgi:hypothetical protein